MPRPVDPTPAKPVDPASPLSATLACEVPHFSGMTTGAGAQATIRIVNTGNRCGVRVALASNLPFNTLALMKSPAHGNVTMEGSSFYYTPASGYVGSDEFTIASSPAGSVRVTVAVLPPEALQR
jgi:Bacterial Ig domain